MNLAGGMPWISSQGREVATEWKIAYAPADQPGAAAGVANHLLDLAVAAARARGYRCGKRTGTYSSLSLRTWRLFRGNPG